jgi:uncharacterized protein YecE (DUF72 family)
MPHLYLGTIGFSYNFWKRSFYPQRTGSKDYLSYYSAKFTTVEIDSSFYRIPSEQTVLNWKQQTSPGFKFTLKFPQLITHIKRLKNAQRETQIFLQRVNLLEEKLGPLLLQFPPNYTSDHSQELQQYLKDLPKNNRYAVEVRSKSWLDNKDFLNFLRANRIALVWAEGPLTPDTDKVTTDFLYLRWEGNRKKVNGTLGKIEIDRKSDLDSWANRLAFLLGQGKDVFGYFGKYFSGFPPSDIIHLQSRSSLKDYIGRKKNLDNKIT